MKARKKLSLSKCIMVPVIVLMCGLVSFCVLGFMSQTAEDQNVSRSIAFAQSEQSDKSAETDNGDAKTNKSSKDTTANKAKNTTETKNASESRNARAGKASSDTKKATAKTVPEGNFEFSEDADCAVCHTMEGDSMTDDAMPASNHEVLKCTTCHSDVEGLEEVHEDVVYGDKTSKRLKKTSVDVEGCETCHGGLEELAEKTTDSIALTDKNGTVVNPHALPENEDHESVDCASCHSMHKDKAVEDTAKKACKGCHHTDVYECNTCHD